MRRSSIGTSFYSGPISTGLSSSPEVSKRHILVDTLGLLLNVVVHRGNVQDRDGIRRLLRDALRPHHLVGGASRNIEPNGVGGPIKPPAATRMTLRTIAGWSAAKQRTIRLPKA
jgi:hypothetical protein